MDGPVGSSGLPSCVCTFMAVERLGVSTITVCSARRHTARMEVWPEFRSLGSTSLLRSASLRQYVGHRAIGDLNDHSVLGSTSYCARMEVWPEFRSNGQPSVAPTSNKREALVRRSDFCPFLTYSSSPSREGIQSRLRRTVVDT